MNPLGQTRVTRCKVLGSKEKPVTYREFLKQEGIRPSSKRETAAAAKRRRVEFYVSLFPVVALMWC
jgi:hypothetical protein